MSELALYVLTYNAPEQLRLWCRCFNEAYPNVFKGVKKYIINNSDDKGTYNKYLQILRRYNFTEINVPQNMGICGGRYIAAEHFDVSVHKYMLFFEDDMLMRKQSRNSCKSGFKLYHDTLFKDIISILEIEKIHFLKICFSEVYGSNHRNWSLKSLTEEDKSEIQKYDIGNIFLAENVCIDYTETFNGLSYGIGAYHYCNWPILFNKEGNKLVFLKTNITSKHELAWMRHAYFQMLLMRE